MDVSVRLAEAKDASKKRAPIVRGLIFLREHEGEYPRCRELVAGILGTIGAGLIVVVDRPEEVFVH